MEIELNVRRVRKFVFLTAILFALFAIGGLWFLAHLFFPAHEMEARLSSVIAVLLASFWFIWTSLDNENKVDAQQILHIRDFYETLYDQSPLPYLTISPNGAIYTGNMASARLFNVKAEQLTNRNFFHYLHHEDENVLAMCFSKIENGISINEQEMQLKVSENDIRWVTLSVFTNQTFNQSLVSLIDITQQKKVDLAKSEFAALVTHQLRTPVAAIRWNIELLQRSLPTPLSAMQDKYFEKVTRNITRMIELINDFLSVSKLETGTFETDPQTIQVNPYFDTIVDEYLGSITEKDIMIQRISNPEDLVLTLDVRLFHIITSNLLSNAIKYTPAGGSITFGYEADNNVCVITVADTGIGVPPSDQAQLFSKFFRASNALRHKAEGTGLGLYIVKQSVEKLGGTITFTSIENKGTTFTVTIPR